MNDSGGHVRVGGSAPVADEQGLDRPGPGPNDRASDSTDAAVTALSEHRAVRLHGLGTSSDSLASFIEVFSSWTQSRVTGIGAQQYAQDRGLFERQKYEDKTLADVIDDALEELADLVNYSSMAAIKLLTLRRRFVK